MGSTTPKVPATIANPRAETHAPIKEGSSTARPEKKIVVAESEPISAARVALQCTCAPWFLGFLKTPPKINPRIALATHPELINNSVDENDPNCANP